MENSSASSFTNLLNSSNFSRQDQQNSSPYIQQFPPQSPFQSSQYAQQFHHQYPPNFLPFGVPTSYHGMLGGATASQLSPVQATNLFGAVGSTTSHGSESTSSMPAQKRSEEQLTKEDSSDSSPDEGKKGTRMKWTQQDNLRLISSWLNNSNDPIDGNSKKNDQYWNKVADDYNSNSPIDRRRSAAQCKNHWNRTNTKVNLFNACWWFNKNLYTSGQSDDQLLEKAHEKYRHDTKGKNFTFMYWRREVKDQPKWRRAFDDQDMNKGAKVSATGTHTSSSNLESEGADRNDTTRPQGQKAAKRDRKGKGKGNAQSTSSPDENMKLYHDLQAKKSAASEKMAEADIKKSAAMEKMAEATKEKAKVLKYDKYVELMKIDTSEMSDAKRKRHEQVIDHLCKDLFGANN